MKKSWNIFLTWVKLVSLFAPGQKKVKILQLLFSSSISRQSSEVHFLSELNSEWGPHFWMQLIQIFRPRRKLKQEKEWLLGRALQPLRSKVRGSLGSLHSAASCLSCQNQVVHSTCWFRSTPFLTFLLDPILGIFTRPPSWYFHSTPFLVFSLALLIFFLTQPPSCDFHLAHLIDIFTRPLQSIVRCLLGSLHSFRLLLK